MKSMQTGYKFIVFFMRNFVCLKKFVMRQALGDCASQMLYFYRVNVPNVFDIVNLDA